jgi:hypothetical protein
MADIKRFDIINALIKKYNYKSYLEIGIYHPDLCFNNVVCESKIGVEPFPKELFPEIKHMTSDVFFYKNKNTFDIIFIDGLHLDYQVFKDINNALKCLNTGGIILAHDCLPAKIEHQTETNMGGAWFGTCWKAIARLRCTRTDLDICTLDTDCGVSVIKSGTQELYPFQDNFTWDLYIKDRINLMNIKPTFKWFDDNGLEYDRTATIWGDSPIKELYENI